MADIGDKRVALITGASRGIGEASAHVLAEQGRHIVLVSRTQGALDSVRESIESKGGSATVKTCDVGDGDALGQLVDGVVDEFGRLDILVNNAGVTRDTLILRMSEEDWDEVIRVNLRSAFITCRTAAKAMVRGKWGRIINISSVSGVIGNAGQTNYAASKAGLIGLTKSLAKELSSKNITSNVVAPGFIDAEMTTDLPEQVKKFAKSVTPLKRFGNVDEIAAAVGYFASDAAAYTTGQVLCVDGGMTMC